MPRREYKGAAAPTFITAGFDTTGSLAATIDDPTGWPTGGGNGKFWVTVDRGLANEETILIQSRSGNNLTVASVADRGVDDTAASAHTPGVSTIEHTYSKTDADEANQHIFDVAQDHHTQYMRADGTRHDLTARHTAGTVIPTGTPTTITPDATPAEGAGTTLARASHVHGISTAVPVAIGTALAEGAGSDFARATHVHELGAGSIDTANQFANNVLPLAAIADALITQAKLANLSVGTAQLQDGSVTVAKIGIGDPVNIDGTQTFTGPFNPTGVYGRYYKLGKLVILFAGFVSPGGMLEDIGVNLPFANNASFEGIIAARGRNAGGGGASGLGIISPSATEGTNIVSIGTDFWGPGVPISWNLGATFRSVSLYVAAA
jgi:hypothetical protein